MMSISIKMNQINQISRCQSLYRAEHLPISDLSPIHHTFVFAICKSPGLSQEQIARRLCFNKSTVARRLTHLEEHGYITRITDESDKRVMLVYPTEKMLNIFPKVREISKEWNALVARDISDCEMEIFLSVLERISHRAKELVESEEGGTAN